MRDLKLTNSPEDFIWATGIEDTFVPQTKTGHRALDEYQLMDHYTHWKEDLNLAKEVGVQAIRWGIPWYRIEQIPGEYDWSWVDEVLPYIVEDLGIVPIIDLMHYGCPFWLRREFASSDYPKAVASFSRAFAERYSGLVKYYTPLNEPLVNSLMCGKRGLWPPYLRGDSGYVRIMLQLVKGIIETVEAVKSVDSNSVMVHVEATGLNRATRDDLQALAVEEQRRGYLSFDLLTGKITPDHPLFTWLVRNGASPDDLSSIKANRIPIDVMGLNFYPQWSTQQLYVDHKGKLAYRSTEHDGAGFYELIEDYYSRYQVPIIVTETSAHGLDETRSEWLEASVAAIKNLRSNGVKVVGYTWFPLFTMVDWRYRYGRRPVEHYYIQLGLYKLHSNQNGNSSRWATTPLVEKFQNYMNDPYNSVGEVLEQAQKRAEQYTH